MCVCVGDVHYPLDTMEKRRQWENAFDKEFILPVLHVISVFCVGFQE